MNLTKLKNRLSEESEDIVEIYKLLKDGFGAKVVDILFYDDIEEVFFDKLNKITIKKDVLDDTSIIGNTFITKNSYFSNEITIENRYNEALDNPFNISMDSQVVIPIFHSNLPKGIVRFSQLPSVFCSKDYEYMIALTPILTKMFLRDNHHSIHDIVSGDINTHEIFTTVEKIKNLFDTLSAQTTNLDTEKVLSIGRDNIDTLIEHLHPIDEESTSLSDILKELEDKTHADILIADDVPINTKILEAMFKDDDTIEQIKCTYNNDDTLKAIEDAKKNDININILFLDHHMSALLTDEVSADLRSKDGFKKKVIIVSTTNDPKAIENKNYFYDYYMPKPFTKENVEKTLNLIKAEHFTNYNI